MARLESRYAPRESLAPLQCFKLGHHYDLILKHGEGIMHVCLVCIYSAQGLGHLGLIQSEVYGKSSSVLGIYIERWH